MLLPGLKEPIQNGSKEGPGPRGGFHEPLRRQVGVGDVAAEIENQLNDPPSGEDLPVLSGGEARTR
jgi:hypothetical protein